MIPDLKIVIMNGDSYGIEIETTRECLETLCGSEQPRSGNVQETHAVSFCEENELFDPSAFDREPCSQPDLDVNGYGWISREARGIHVVGAHVLSLGLHRPTDHVSQRAAWARLYARVGGRCTGFRFLKHRLGGCVRVCNLIAKITVMKNPRLYVGAGDMEDSSWIPLQGQKDRCTRSG